ncbi:MAG: HEAT repeat domain-containing protein, partial [Deltaproteobacteria bacterium]|nr:HEAT repeat domain-containing protein [Deltaproteobacteria bacterium]
MSSTKNKKTLLFLLIVVIIIAAAIWFFSRQEKKGFEYAFDWPRGNVYVYEVSYNTKNATNISFTPGNPKAEAQSFLGSVNLTGEMKLRSYGEHKGSYFLGVTLDDFTALELTVMGKSMYDDQAAVKAVFAGHEGLVEISKQGEVKKISFEESSPPVFKNMVQNLVGEVQVVVESGSEKWEVLEKNQYGETPSSYALKMEDGDEVEVDKSRLSYASLHAVPGELVADEVDVKAGYDVRLSRAGHVTHFGGTEEIAVKEGGKKTIFSVETSVSMKLARIDEFRSGEDSPYARFSKLTSRKLGELVVSDEAERRSLEQRAGGMKIDKLVDDLLKFANAGEMPFHTRWVWRATGALRLDPKACWELVDVFEDDVSNQKTRNMVVELLVSVGHGEAQAVLRKILGGSVARKSPRYWDTLQRLMLLTEPDAETGRFVQAKVSATAKAETKDDVHFASAIALGGLAKNIRKNGDPETAAEYNKQLVELLGEADTVTEKAAYLKSLGNSADESNVEIISSFADDKSAPVRVSVADALRDTQTEKSEQTVMQLTEDSIATVQKSALRVMANYDAKEEHLFKIKDLVDDDTVQSQSYGALMDVLTKNRRHGSEK